MKRFVFKRLFLCSVLLLLIIQDLSASTKDSEQIKVPDNIVTAPDGDVFVFVEKQTQKVDVWQMNNAVPERIFTTRCSTGKAIGAKQKSGDAKTPEGVYFFTGHFPDKYLAPVYGKRALTLDYPNQIDVITKKTGNAIWLHGTNKVMKNRDSNGCVALENNDIQKISDLVSLNRSAVIIGKTITYSDTIDPDGLKQKVVDMIRGWAASLTDSPYHDYLSYYSHAYLPDMGWWEPWRQTVESFESQKGSLLINTDNISVIRFDNYLTVLFDLVIQYDGVSIVAGTRKMYLTENNGRYTIVGDAFKQITEGPDAVGQKPEFGSLMMASVNSLVKAIEKRKQEQIASAYREKVETIRHFVNQWVNAWANGDFDYYQNCYSEQFESSGLNKPAWIERKKKLDEMYQYINIQLGEIQVKFVDGKGVAVFGEKYRSSGYQAAGTKKLVLIQEDKQWKIFREIWKKS